MSRIAIAATLGILLPVSLSAQWLGFREPGIVRTADGKPDLNAPLPRMPDGKPDLSGLWEPQASPYRFGVIQDLKDEGVFRPEAEALFLKRAANFGQDNPVTHCLPAGPSSILAFRSLYRIIQSSKVIGLLYESGGFRQIYTDGRPLPKDPNPTWMGYSVGRWDGDTLVVESAGFNDKTWLDMAGHPHSESLRVTERFRRSDFGHMQVQITYDDPEVLIRPLTMSVAIKYAADSDTLESVCNEGERDAAHLMTEIASAPLNPTLLAKYTGEYRFREGPASIKDVVGPVQIVSVLHGQLFMHDFPLIPQAENRFGSVAGTAEFVVDSSGKVTSLVLHGAESVSQYDRKR